MGLPKFVPTVEETYRQSRGALKQWGDQWRENSKYSKSVVESGKGFGISKLRGLGINKYCIAVAYGPSLRNAYEYLRILKAFNNFEIICVDKAFHALMDNGIIPDYCLVADANVNWEKYGEKWDTAKTKLIANVNANPKWGENWDNTVYYFVNKDNIGTEHIFSEISGVTDIIMAASNVGNSIIVVGHSIFKYDKYFLIGYDFCWGYKEQYYGNEENLEKRNNMNHLQILDNNYRLVCTSVNLQFSAKWLATYIMAEKPQVINCSPGILQIPIRTDLKNVIPKGVNNVKN
jgi:hypothetical protein